MLNANLILAGQQPDVVNTLARADVAGAQARDIQRQNALNMLFQTQGDKIAAGDQNALNMLSRFDPTASLGIQGTRQDMAQSAGRYDMDRQSHGLNMRTGERRLQILNAQERRAIEEHAASLSAAEAAAQRADIESDLAALMTAQTPEQWDALAQQTDNPNFVGGFQNREALIAPYLGLKEVLERQAKPELPSSVQALQWRAEQAGLAPGSPEYQAFMAEGDAPSTNITLNTGDQQPQTGAIPPGFARIADPNNPDNPSGFRDVAIPGGKEDTSEFDRKALQNYEQKFAIVDDKLDQAIGQLQEGGRMVAGFGSMLSAIPETNARDFQATVDTIKANLGFEELNAMRESSPTGGALGQVTEREIAFLQAIQGNLDTAQSPKQLLDTLREIKTRRAQFREERNRIIAGQEGASSGPVNYSSMAPQELLNAPIPTDPAGLAAWNAAMDAAGF